MSFLRDLWQPPILGARVGIESRRRDHHLRFRRAQAGNAGVVVSAHERRSFDARDARRLARVAMNNARFVRILAWRQRIRALEMQMRIRDRH